MSWGGFELYRVNIELADVLFYETFKHSLPITVKLYKLDLSYFTKHALGIFFLRKEKVTDTNKQL